VINNTFQEFLSQIRFPFLGDNLMRKYENEKSPLRSELFSTEQLEQYALSLAALHTLSSDPVPEQLLKRLDENEAILIEVRNLLIESAKENSLISPAGEWLLDNFYSIEEQIQIGKKHFPKSYSETLPRLAKGPLAGLPRVYDIALEIIAHSDGRVDPENLYSFVTTYQEATNLKLGELWAIPIMLRIALIENLRRLAATIARDRINKNLADYWADKMTETAEKDPKSLIVVTADMARSNPPIVSSFVAELTRRLLGKGPALSLPLSWVEQRLAENGLTTNMLVHQENQKQAADQVSMSNSISSLRFINNADWREFVEKTSGVERILRTDIGGTYGHMDFITRDHYRHRVEAIAKRSGTPEPEVASMAIDAAREMYVSGKGNQRNTHVGFYLTGKGVVSTEKSAGIKFTWFEKLKCSLAEYSFTAYAGSIILLTLLLSGILVRHAYHQHQHLGWLIMIAILTIMATSQLATAIVNWFATLMVQPDFMSRMDYSRGIPPSSRTLVAVPTLFNSSAELDHLLESMEVRFLANKQDNLHFALITDFRDAPVEVLPGDKDLLTYAEKRIRELNTKYSSAKEDTFFLLHRPRLWNAVDKIWMGYERKRGKLGDLNAILRGHGQEKFSLIAGDQSVLQAIKYVITLDTDTQLPREAAWKIMAALDHPLNHPHYDPIKNRITDGYGILQPRLASSLPHSGSSWFARIHGNEEGIDPYTRVISDVYQDVLKEGSFVGKGIYDVDAFEKTLSERFPENRILSHDLLEGCHARSGLISDVQLYEEHPSTYLADVKRRHRWIRGDWQITRWLYPSVPGYTKGNQKNQLTALSRWKIFDNLRRSLVPQAMLIIFLFGWIISSTPWFWTFSVIGIIIPPSVLSFGWSFLTKTPDVKWKNHIAASKELLVNNLVRHAWTIISLPYEAYVNTDAISRTMWRMHVSRKNLLQWDPFHAGPSTKSLGGHFKTMWFGSFSGSALILLLPFISWPAFIIASPILSLWIVSPFIAWWISLPQQRKKASLSKQQNQYLQNLARKTWAFFENFMGPDDNWLPPDNYQENPEPRIAHRTSPTNIGLSLLSSLAAHDFGYLTTLQLLDRSQKTLSTMQTLERHKGHFLNWYHTQTLLPLHPRYVSTVDSGNLAACMLTFKEGLLSLHNLPVLREDLYNGLTDTINVLREKAKEPSAFQKIIDAWHAMGPEESLRLSSAKTFLDTLLPAAEAFLDQQKTTGSNEGYWWAETLVKQCSDAAFELSTLTGWMQDVEQHQKLIEVFRMPDQIPSLNDLMNMTEVILPKLENSIVEENGPEEKEWLIALESSIRNSRLMAEGMIESIAALEKQCIEFSDYDYDFLFDPVQHFFSIGYNVEDHRRDPGCYDLLGSEARLGVFVAIAQGKIPQESWFALGRQLTMTGKDPVLISWSGSMFEYLMPLLIAPVYESTLLDQTHKGAVRRQIEYGQRRGLPWGLSESCFSMVHANMDYMYRAFGVPGLGLKRGLADDYVVAPYASIMALMIEPDEAYENLKEMSLQGFEGKWGFYEAIDYTASRLQRGQTESVVKAFMAHHQGMSLLSLDYLLRDQPMQKRFQADLRFQTSLLLLQEKIPQITTYFAPMVDITDLPSETVNTDLRVIPTSDTLVPEVQLLSNGRYHVMVSNAGGGYSRWKDTAVTRWREDGTCDNWGSFCYIRDLETGAFWSSGHQPTVKQTEHYEVIFSQGRAEIKRRDYNIDVHTEIVVSPEDDVELRRLHITNRSRKKRQIEFTSYAEVVLNSGMADMLHPAFSNLFVQTEIIPPRHAIMCTRRPRSVEEHPLWMFHLMKVHGVDVQEVSFETSRDHFIGRGNTISDPQSMMQKEGLSGNEGSILDPIVAIQYRVTLKPYETITLDMVYGIGGTQEEGQRLVEKYQDKHMIDRAFELAWTHSQVELRQINATAAEALLYCRMAGSIIYANASFRADPAIILKNHREQSGLWSHSISGDFPIVLLQIEDNTNIELVEQMVKAHAFWRQKGLIVDLVIWNEDHGGYRQVLQNQILSLIAPTNIAEEQNWPGSIFIRSADQLSNEDRILFQTIARVIISDKLGTLEGQLNRRKKLKPILPNFIAQKFFPIIESALETREDLLFFNGIGGFSKNGKEYVITTKPDQVTPAPWSNVIANPQFGTVISESGQSYTWFQNAHEQRLTPWHNDPVTDMGGEHFYIRDEETGRFWSPAPLPVRGKTPYITRHGFGYSVFEHLEDGIHTTMRVYTDTEKPIKYSVISIENQSERTRQLSATGYVEWVLGDLQHKTKMHITTEVDLNSDAIIACNSYSTEFGRLLAFFDVNDPGRIITTDREEFLGRNGTAKKPEALRKAKLSGRTGAALDPCAAIQVTMTLEVGEKNEFVFRLGAASQMEDLRYLIGQGRGKTAAKEAFEKVKVSWDKSLSVIKVESPDLSLNTLTNGWLNYQTLSCRLWARSGFYQSGGAYGFRDQLQDVLSLLHNEPVLARQQILLCASRQFAQGDVQHWWHPPAGRGVRTRCSDDYLWLPYVTSSYVLVTGDVSILDEQVQYLESRPLAKEEHSYYDMPIRSDQTASLYDHCVKAIEFGLQFGQHGLPLMGAGDWNDGMDRVGSEGKGESVWLAWFLSDTIQRFSEVAGLKEDQLLLNRFEVILSTLKENIEKNAWDGEWYRRAYFDDGTPLGSKTNEECKIDSIAQSWAVISGVGDKERSHQGMREAEKRLVRKQDKIIQLFDPPFDTSDLNPGYIKGYVPGVRENGGQYTHAAIWMIMAFAAMRDKEKMWDLLQMINPINHGSTPEGMQRYKVEPYVVAADVYAVSQHSGRGGWTWYTGSAGWLYQLIVDAVIGLKRRRDMLHLDPCLPTEWGNVSIQYKFKTSVYMIEMLQEGSGTDGMQIMLDGDRITGNSIKLVDDGQEHQVSVKM